MVDFIPTAETNLSAPRDIAVTSDGTIYVVDEFNNNNVFNSRVLRYNAIGTFRNQLIATKPLDSLHLDRRPRLELGPDDRLYLSDPVSGKVNRYDRITGTLLGDPFLNTTTVNAGYPSFLAFAQNRPLSFEVLTNNPLVTGQMLSNGALQLTRTGNFTGPVAVTVRAWDGPSDVHDFQGRFAETRFDLNILSSSSNAIYGTVFDDLNQNSFQDSGEPGLENVLVYRRDTNDNSAFAPASDPFVRTDANGDYSFVGLSNGTHFIREVADANSSVVRGSQSIFVSSGMFTAADLANFVEVNAGPDRLTDEGSTVNLTANLRRPGLTVQHASGFAFDPFQSDFTEFNGKLYFSGSTAAAGQELFVYDPATDIVSLAANIQPDNSSSNPSDLTVFNGKLYFVADSPLSGRELYEFDGTTATLRDLVTGSTGSFPSELTVFGGNLYFAASTSANGDELFRFDGSTMTLAADIFLGGSSNPRHLTVFGSDLYFSAFNIGVGFELFKFNGTIASLAVDVNPDGPSSPSNLAVVGSNLFFSATAASVGTELFSFNGTTLTPFDTATGASASSNPSELTAVGSDLYFAAGSGSNGSVDREIYRLSGGIPQRIEINLATGGWIRPNELEVVQRRTLLLCGGLLERSRTVACAGHHRRFGRQPQSIGVVGPIPIECVQQHAGVHDGG